jgi:hypothetical protein
MSASQDFYLYAVELCDEVVHRRCRSCKKHASKGRNRSLRGRKLVSPKSASGNIATGRRTTPASCANTLFVCAPTSFTNRRLSRVRGLRDGMRLVRIQPEVVAQFASEIPGKLARLFPVLETTQESEQAVVLI